MKLSNCTYHPDIDKSNVNIIAGGKRSGKTLDLVDKVFNDIETLKSNWIKEALTKILGTQPIEKDYQDIKIHQYTSHDYLMITYKNVHIAKMQTKFNVQTKTINFTITPMPIETIAENLNLYPNKL